MLTPKQEAMAQGLARGLSQSEAYRQAYPKALGWRDATVWSRASEVASSGEVQARVAQLRAEIAEKGLWSREQSVRILADIAENGFKEADKVKAVAELNRMHGFEAPQKLEHSNPDGSMTPLTVVIRGV